MVAIFCEAADLSLPPGHVGAPLPAQAVTNRAFTGISSMAVAPKRRLWVTWYAGVTPGEDHNNYVVLSTSGDDGKTWKEILVVDPDGAGPIRCFDPELWLAPNGHLFLFWAQSTRKDTAGGNVWCLETADPEAETPEWKAPRSVARGVMMCKPIVLSTGEWALPVARWHRDSGAKMVVSTDAGKTWSLRGACNVPKGVRNCDEHMLIERRDQSLWMLVRTNYGIGESISTDRGKTWPELKPSSIPHPTARFFITRLASGNLLLVKHGPMDKRIGRSHLTAFVSRDDGRSWSGGLLLDERPGVSYPDGQQTADGTIYITYDYSRTRARNILFATFREADVVAGKAVSGTVRLRQLVSQGSGGAKPKPKPVKANADGVELQRSSPGAWAGGGSKVSAFREGARLFSDRKYILAECPDALKGAKFVVVKIDGPKTLSCAAPGMLHVLTPLPARNRDSVVAELLKQGFEKVSLPEVRLFDPTRTSNYCTLYQKNCTAGEVIRIGKWGVPLFFVK